LRPGSLLTLFSDGISEADTDSGERFGEARVGAVLRASGAVSAAAVLDRLLGAVARFTGSAEQADDLSLVVIRRQSEASEGDGRGGGTAVKAIIAREARLSLPFLSPACVRG
jgi:hypothetical protein